MCQLWTLQSNAPATWMLRFAWKLHLCNRFSIFPILRAKFLDFHLRPCRCLISMILVPTERLQTLLSDGSGFRSIGPLVRELCTSEVGWLKRFPWKQKNDSFSRRDYEQFELPADKPRVPHIEEVAYFEKFGAHVHRPNVAWKSWVPKRFEDGKQAKCFGRFHTFFCDISPLHCPISVNELSFEEFFMLFVIVMNLLGSSR